MSETRLLPPQKPRSTGITQVAQIRKPVTSSQQNHLSAAPGASAKIQASVLSARSGPVGRAGKSSDATVELIERHEVEGRRGAAPHAAAPHAPGQGPAVQIVGRPRGSGQATGAAVPGLDLSETMLTASLLEQYAERASAAGDHVNANVAKAALSKLAGNSRPASAAPVSVIHGGSAIKAETTVEVIPAPVSRPASSSTPDATPTTGAGGSAA